MIVLSYLFIFLALPLISTHVLFIKSLPNFSLIIFLPVEDMCRRYPNATEVNIVGAPVIHSLVMTAMSSLR